MASRIRTKGRKESGSFIMLPHVMLEHGSFTSLSHRAVRLLIDIYFQFKGKNNGDLCVAWSIMRKRGWKSKDQLQKAKTELMEKGWIVLTRQGGRKKPSLYAVTFKAIDECGNKLDRKFTTTPLGYWKLGQNPELNSLPQIRTTLDPHAG